MKIIAFILYFFFITCALPADSLADEAAANTGRDAGRGLLGSPRMPMGLPLNWQRVVALMPREKGILATCSTEPERCPSDRILAWLKALESFRDLPAQAQLAKVNSWANARPYRNDDTNFGRPDYYATPLEFLERSGDCEDYAIFKYFALSALGFPEESLQVVLVENLRERYAHAVLAVRLDDGVFILDNAADRVARQSAVQHYRPFASFTRTQAWIHLAS